MTHESLSDQALAPHDPATADVLAAIDVHRLHQLSFWDALIVRAAIASACTIIYSEDMQAGRTIDGLRLVNPFA